MEERSWFVVVGKMNLEEDKWEISSGSPFFKDPGQVTPRPNASDNTHPHTKYEWKTLWTLIITEIHLWNKKKYLASYENANDNSLSDGSLSKKLVFPCFFLSCATLLVCFWLSANIGKVIQVSLNWHTNMEWACWWWWFFWFCSFIMVFLRKSFPTIFRSRVFSPSCLFVEKYW